MPYADDDPIVEKAREYAKQFLTAYEARDPLNVDRIADSLKAEEDPELIVLVIDRLCQVFFGILRPFTDAHGIDITASLRQAFLDDAVDDL